MAGAVRQPIDLASLEAYIKQHVPEVKVPFDIKQVRSNAIETTQRARLTFESSVWLRPIQSNVPAHGQSWHEIRAAQEATRSTRLQDSAQS
jgi:hypothetical protein